MPVSIRSDAAADQASVEKTPFELIGGRDQVFALANAFYDDMEEHEPELTRVHPLDDQGKVTERARSRFALFLVGWLGGPDDYVKENGHPRLRMRHGRVPVSIALRDAWLRSMKRAMVTTEVPEGLRGYLEPRFADVADFMRNVRE